MMGMMMMMRLEDENDGRFCRLARNTTILFPDLGSESSPRQPILFAGTTDNDST